MRRCPASRQLPAEEAALQRLTDNNYWVSINPLSRATTMAAANDKIVDSMLGAIK